MHGYDIPAVGLTKMDEHWDSEQLGLKPSQHVLCCYPEFSCKYVSRKSILQVTVQVFGMEN